MVRRSVWYSMDGKLLYVTKEMEIVEQNFGDMPRVLVSLIGEVQLPEHSDFF